MAYRAHHLTVLTWLWVYKQSAFIQRHMNRDICMLIAHWLYYDPVDLRYIQYCTVGRDGVARRYALIGDRYRNLNNFTIVASACGRCLRPCVDEVCPKHNTSFSNYLQNLSSQERKDLLQIFRWWNKPKTIVAKDLKVGMILFRGDRIINVQRSKTGTRKAAFKVLATTQNQNEVIYGSYEYVFILE